MEKINIDGIYFTTIKDIYGYDFKIGEFPAYFVKKAKKYNFINNNIINVPEKLKCKKIILVKKESASFDKIVPYYEEALTGVHFSISNKMHSCKHLERFPLLLSYSYLISFREYLGKILTPSININPYDYFGTKELLSEFEIDIFMECLEPYLKLYEELGFKRETLVNNKPLGKKLVRTPFDNKK